MAEVGAAAREAAGAAVGAALAPLGAPGRGPARGSAAAHARALAHVKQELEHLPEVLTAVEQGLAGLQGDLAPLGRPRGGSGPSDAPDSAPP